MIYKIKFSNKATDQVALLNSKDKQLLRKCIKLMDAVLIDPRIGIGKPERLKHYDKQEVWSRRIDKKNRLVYEIDDDQIIILSVWKHY